MRFAPNTKTAFAAAIAIALTAGFASDAFAQLRSNPGTQPALGKMTTPGGGNTAREPEHCNNVASCNIMIAYCIGNGGDFDVEGSSGTGQPSKGTCTY